MIAGIYQRSFVISVESPPTHGEVIERRKSVEHLRQKQYRFSETDFAADGSPQLVPVVHTSTSAERGNWITMFRNAIRRLIGH